MREKITILLESLPLEVKNIFSDIEVNYSKNKKFFENFAVRLKDTRNYYIHGANPNKNKRRFKSTSEIIKVNQVLDYVIYYLVLERLGQKEKILNYPFLRSKISVNKLIQ